MMTRLMPRKRTILGGVLAVGILAGIWFGDKLPHLGSGFGLGSGGDGLIGKPNVSAVSVNAKNATKSDDAADSKSDKSATAKVRKPAASDTLPPDDVVTVLVEEHHYAVWKKTRKGNGYFPTELPAIIELALKTPSNSEGLRVRVVYTKAARYPAWHTLQQKLVEAGVPADAVVLTDELVD